MRGSKIVVVGSALDDKMVRLRHRIDNFDLA